MLELPWAKMPCDTTHGAGGLYFYEEHLEWRPKSGALMHLKFDIRYDEIKDIVYTPTHKKTVDIILKDDSKYTLMMYKIEYFTGCINERLDNLKHPKKSSRASASEAPKEEDKFAKLKELVEMKEKNLLTDEEFAAAKAKLLGL